jgi:hypothetical protein
MTRHRPANVGDPDRRLQITQFGLVLIGVRVDGDWRLGGTARGYQGIFASPAARQARGIADALAPERYVYASRFWGEYPLLLSCLVDHEVPAAR